MTDKNRHEREPDMHERMGDPELGFVVGFTDPDPRPDTSSRFVSDGGVADAQVQIKPHPMGYQVTMWWTTEEGERRQRDEVINFKDPRME